MKKRDPLTDEELHDLKIIAIENDQPGRVTTYEWLQVLDRLLNREARISLRYIDEAIKERGVFSYKSPFEDKFILITEVDDVYFNAEIKNGFGQPSSARIAIADLIEAADVETYLAGIASRLKGEET